MDNWSLRRTELLMDLSQYLPSVSDSVIAVVLRSTSEAYLLSIPGSPNQGNVTLPHLAFENATKKTRPILQPGALVYCRVSLANKFMDPEVECFNNQTGKADGFGELKGGMLFTISLGLARRLLGDGKKLRHLRIRQSGQGKVAMSTGLEVVEELGSKLTFEIAVGRNGRIWVNSPDVKTTVFVGKCIQDSEFLTGQEQKDMVRERIKQANL